MSAVSAPAPAPAVPAPGDVGGRRTAAAMFAWLAGALVLAALAVQVVPVVDTFARDVYPNGPRPGADATVLSLWFHNTVIALLPFVLALGRWGGASAWRRAGDVLIGLMFTVNAAALGLGIGAHPSVLRFVPHIPLELLALAAGFAGWWHLSRGGSRRGALRFAAFVVVVLLVGALVEVLSKPR